MKIDRRESGMDFTGERFLFAPSEAEIELEHVHRYLAARTICAGKNVLDVACGEGYGSALLAQVSKHVTGVDVDQAACELARAKYGSTNLDFLTGDIKALPFEDSVFDVIVSVETLEHVSEHNRVIAEFRRVLKDEGVLIISTPDKTIYNRDLREPNPFHVRELEREEFRELLAATFRNVNLYGQRVVFGSLLVSPDPAGMGLEAIRRAGHTNLIGSQDAYAASVYLLGVCSDGPLPLLRAGIYEGGIPQNAMASLLGGLSERDQLIAQLRSDAERLAASGEVSGLEAVMGGLETRLLSLTNGLAERLGAIQSRIPEAAEDPADGLKSSGGVVEQLEAVRADLADIAQSELRIRAEVDRRSSELSAMVRNESEELGARLTAATAKVAHEILHAARKNAAQSEADMMAIGAQLALVRKSIDQNLSATDELAELRRVLDEASAEASRSNVAADELRAQLNLVRSSWSWRITRPLRAALRVVRGGRLR